MAINVLCNDKDFSKIKNAIKASHPYANLFSEKKEADGIWRIVYGGNDEEISDTAVQNDAISSDFY